MLWPRLYLHPHFPHFTLLFRSVSGLHCALIHSLVSQIHSPFSPHKLLAYSIPSAWNTLAPSSLHLANDFSELNSQFNCKFFKDALCDNQALRSKPRLKPGVLSCYSPSKSSWYWKMLKQVIENQYSPTWEKICCRLGVMSCNIRVCLNQRPIYHGFSPPTKWTHLGTKE